MNLVLIETSGNQQYIFSTNKLRENVGASELTYRAGTEFVLAEVRAATTRPTLWSESDEELRSNLLNDSLNPQLETDKDKHKIEVILATSGKAVLLVNSPDTARDLIGRVTSRALREIPGLTIHGAISRTIKDDLSDVNDGIKEIHEKLEENRYKVPSQHQRFLRLPFSEPCLSTGLPASEYRQFEQEERPYALSTVKKCDQSGIGWQRIRQMIKRVAPNVRLVKNIRELEQRFKNLNWLSVIHADGNGLGEIFLEFGAHAEPVNGRDYLDKYRRFSLALDVCTINAFGYALEEMKKRFQSEGNKTHEVPVVPLVLGGDDLTVLCDGEYALRFTRDFLARFEEETTKNHLKKDGEPRGIVPAIAFRKFNAARLSICGGVSIVKPHFPFHAAYELAEALLRSAKQVKEEVKHNWQNARGEQTTSLPCSAIDYHILYDSSGADLELIREKLKPEADKGTTHLFAKPYIVTATACIGSATNQSWVQKRTWSQLHGRVEAMGTEDEEGRHALPNSMLHDLREALFRGHREADALMQLVRERYEAQGFNKILGRNDATKSLFWADGTVTVRDPDGKEDEVTLYETNFLDALDAVGFWK